jgi:hypothetical protein
LAGQGVKLARNVKTITYSGDRDNARMTLVLVGVIAISAIFSAFQVRGGAGGERLVLTHQPWVITLS